MRWIWSVRSGCSGHTAREACASVASAASSSAFRQWLRGCYSYLSSSTSVVTMSFARPVYVPVRARLDQGARIAEVDLCGDISARGVTYLLSLA